MDLALENAALKAEVEDLRFRLGEAQGRLDDERFSKLRLKLKLSPKAARLAMILSDGKFHTLNSLIYALDLEERESQNLPVHICRVRHADPLIKIVNVRSGGYFMQQASCDFVMSIMEGGQE